MDESFSALGEKRGCRAIAGESQINQDISLVQSARNGDIEAFSTLVRTYTNAVCAVAYGVLRDFHLAQDVAQETFVKAYHGFHTLNQPEKFGSWLYAIATRLSIDLKRKQNRDSRLQNKLSFDQASYSTEEVIVQKELRLDILEALHKLDDLSRTVVLSYYISEMSMPEIAKALQVSVSAVESRIRRNRKLLREDYLSAWAVHFDHPHTKETVVTKVVERIVKQAGQYYIPVTNRANSTDWFVRHFGLSLDHNGHLQLPSGHTLFLIEVKEEVLSNLIRSPLPVLVFLADNPTALFDELKERGIRVERGEAATSEQFFFFDLDGNRFGVFSEK